MTSHICGLKALVELSSTYEDCRICEKLCESRSQVVFGSGSSSASIMVIAEAPGEEEDAEGAPFLGQSVGHFGSICR